MPQTIQLPDHLTLLVEELPHTRSVSLGCFVRVGSGHEEAALAGASHFIEHMLFKGSRGYPSPKQISDTVEGVGGLLDAYTDLESTVYYAKVADLHFDQAAALMGDMLTRPLFDPRDVEKERRVITEELRETLDTPSEQVHALLDQAMWGDQPLGRDVAGDLHSVAALRGDQLHAFWKRHYTRENLILSVAGNIQAERAAKLLGDAFRDLPGGAPYPAIMPGPHSRGPQLVLESDDSEQANFCLGLPGLAIDDPDRWAMLALDTILGGGMASRLVQAIREERGLAYSIGSSNREHLGAGKWLVYGSVDPERLHECIAAIMTELQAVRQSGITAAELAQVTEQVKGSLLISLEDTWSVASRNGSHQLYYGQVIPIEQVVAEVESVTLADVRRVAERVLREDALHLAVIGPIEGEAERARLSALLRLP